MQQSVYSAYSLCAAWYAAQSDLNPGLEVFFFDTDRVGLQLCLPIVQLEQTEFT